MKPFSGENLENGKAEPILVSHFDDIRQKPEINPVIDDFSDVFSDEQNRKHSFEEAQKAFQFVFNKQSILHQLKQKTNKESIAYLKQIRRFGLVLRDMYKFFDSSHKCVEKLDNFLSLLGKYNDRYWESPSGEVKEDVINNLDDIKFSVNFGSTSEFKEYATSILFKIQELLKATELTADKFHSLRKKIRSFANIIQPMAAEKCGGKFHWLFYSLFKLSEKMGEHHDNLIQKELHGKIDYHRSTVKVNPDIVYNFKILKPLIERVCGLTI